jgi:hypothetical protein
MALMDPSPFHMALEINSVRASAIAVEEGGCIIVNRNQPRVGMPGQEI